MARKRMTFDEMRNDGREPEPTNGVKCPKCGAGHLVANNKQTLPGGTIHRYRYCRVCKQGFLYSQPPERMVREVKPHKVDDDDSPGLRIARSA